jgi:hypothetical protein
MDTTTFIFIKPFNLEQDFDDLFIYVQPQVLKRLNPNYRDRRQYFRITNPEAGKYLIRKLRATRVSGFKKAANDNDITSMSYENMVKLKVDHKQVVFISKATRWDIIKYYTYSHPSTEFKLTLWSIIIGGISIVLTLLLA